MVPPVPDGEPFAIERDDGKAPVKFSERQFSSGMLSMTATYRLLITGECGVQEIDRLIQMLILQRNALEEKEAPKISRLVPHE